MNHKCKQQPHMKRQHLHEGYEQRAHTNTAQHTVDMPRREAGLNGTKRRTTHTHTTNKEQSHTRAIHPRSANGEVTMTKTTTTIPQQAEVGATNVDLPAHNQTSETPSQAEMAAEEV